MSLNKFCDWANQKIQLLEGKDIEIALIRSLPSDNSSARVDIITGNYVGRITFWDSGDTDLEILEIRSEKTVFHRNQKLLNLNFDQQFEGFLQVLKI